MAVATVSGMLLRGAVKQTVQRLCAIEAGHSSIEMNSARSDGFTASATEGLSQNNAVLSNHERAILLDSVESLSADPTVMEAVSSVSERRGTPGNFKELVQTTADIALTPSELSNGLSSYLAVVEAGHELVIGDSLNSDQSSLLQGCSIQLGAHVSSTLMNHPHQVLLVPTGTMAYGTELADSIDTVNEIQSELAAHFESQSQACINRATRSLMRLPQQVRNDIMRRNSDLPTNEISKREPATKRAHSSGTEEDTHESNDTQEKRDQEQTTKSQRKRSAHVETFSAWIKDLKVSLMEYIACELVKEAYAQTLDQDRVAVDEVEAAVKMIQSFRSKNPNRAIAELMILAAKKFIQGYEKQLSEIPESELSPGEKKAMLVAAKIAINTLAAGKRTAYENRQVLVANVRKSLLIAGASGVCADIKDSISINAFTEHPLVAGQINSRVAGDAIRAELIQDTTTHLALMMQLPIDFMHYKDTQTKHQPTASERMAEALDRKRLAAASPTQKNAQMMESALSQMESSANWAILGEFYRWIIDKICDTPQAGSGSSTLTHDEACLLVGMVGISEDYVRSESLMQDIAAAKEYRDNEADVEHGRICRVRLLSEFMHEHDAVPYSKQDDSSVDEFLLELCSEIRLNANDPYL